jgi:hypothetical protein
MQGANRRDETQMKHARLDDTKLKYALSRRIATKHI